MDLLTLEGFCALTCIAFAAWRRRVLTLVQATECFFAGMKLFLGAIVLLIGLLPGRTWFTTDTIEALRDLRLPLILAGVMTLAHGLRAMILVVRQPSGRARSRKNGATSVDTS